MSDHEKAKEQLANVAVSSAGATAGGAGGATIGILELAARGAVTELSAGVVIGAGAVAGAGLAYGIFRLIRNRRKSAKKQPLPNSESGEPDSAAGDSLK